MSRTPSDFGKAFTALLTAADLTVDKVLRKRPGIAARDTLYSWKKGLHLPADTAPLLAVVELCLDLAGQRGADLGCAPGDPDGWLALLAEAKQFRDSAAVPRPDPGTGRDRGRGGRFIGRWNPAELGVHKAIGGGQLPLYIHRPHDHLLYALLDPAPAANRLVVLRGGSSTGKSRAAFQAVTARLPHWPVLYPRTSTALARMLGEQIPNRSVLWLNELRDYAEGPAGQDSLFDLAELLTCRNHIVVLTSLWPDFWKAYTTDHHGGPGTWDPVRATRQLLTPLPDLTGADPQDIDPAEGAVINVPDHFTEQDLRAARRRDDTTLNQAIAAAEQAGSAGQVAQFLAGVPDLIEHYQGPGSDAYGHALITAAVDATRLGHTQLLARDLLDHAAVGYLPPQHRALSPQQWTDRQEQGWAYATRTLKGAIQALQPVPPDQGIGVAGYRLADYLDQHGRATRHAHAIPAALWDAFVPHTSHEQLASLTKQARNRGLYRHAARMAGWAAQHGALWAMHRLADEAGRLRDRVCEMAWLRRAAEARDNYAMTRLARKVLAQDPEEAEKWLKAAAQAGDETALDELIKLLDRTDRQPEAEHLLMASMAGGNTRNLMRLVSRLRRAGHHGQAKALLREATENGNARARSALACALVYDGRIDEAETLLPVSACDRYDMDLFNLTRDLFNTGRHVEAEAWLRRLIRDGDIWARYLMVRRLDEHGRRSEGEEWLRSIAESGRIEAISELADRLDTEGKADEAELWHRRSASSQHERRHQSVYWLSKRLDSQGRHGEAMDYRQQAFDTVNGDPMALIGFQHWLTERFGAHEADRVRQDLADLGNWTAALFLAEQLAKHGRYDEAERALRPAAEAGDCLAMGALGELLRDHSDRHGEAEAWLRRAIEAGGAKTSGVVELAQLLTDEGRRDEASRLQRFGLEPGGTTADPWSLTRPMDHLSHKTTQP